MQFYIEDEVEQGTETIHNMVHEVNVIQNRKPFSIQFSVRFSKNNAKKSAYLKSMAQF